MSRFFAALFALALVLSIPTESRADRRIFGYTYPYQTAAKGTLELEHYLDLGLRGMDNPATPETENEWTRPDWRHQVEFEYGVTDHLDFGLYNVFRQRPYGTLGYEGIKLRSRYRFGEQGLFPVDPAVYLEVAYFGNAVKVEEILILSKILGRFEFSFNAKFEEEYSLTDKAWEYEILPLAGIGYHFNNHVALSLEYYGKLKIANGEKEYFINYLGPAVSVAGNGFFWTLAILPLLGSEDGVAQIQARSLFGATF